MGNKYDFGGWATKNDLKCSDGRIIRKDAFAHCDGLTVPLIWNHDHSDPYAVVGNATLENRAEGVYAYGSFNNSELGQQARECVQHGDINMLSIYANHLRQQGPNVMHGMIREVSLVLASANPGAYIDSVLQHGEECEDEAVIYTGEFITSYLSHSDEDEDSKEDESMAGNEEKTIQEIYDSMDDDQKQACHAMVGFALEEAGVLDDEDDNEGGGDMAHSEGGMFGMKKNVWDQESMETGEGYALSHADEENIIALAKQTGVGSFRDAWDLYAEENSLSHGIDELETLFPEYKDVRPGAPELITRDQTWVASVMQKTHKSPITRIRTRFADARAAELTAYGYQKGEQKKDMANLKLLKRTTDPQTVYIKDHLHRDDINDITDFDLVNYLQGVMKMNLNEKVALAILIGDGLDDNSEDKIFEEHIRSIWNDEELYTIHQDVDFAAAKAELQGTNTGANFGDNYIYAEAIIQAALYSREKYKGSGNLEFYCTPHLLNVMLLARDLNGRRIYESKAALTAALNVSAIHTVEQFEGRVRQDAEGNNKKLLGLFVNLSDYQVGCTKGGEITKFSDFDIDFNQHKYLIETRLSGALTKVYSAIALEEPVTEATAG